MIIRSANSWWKNAHRKRHSSTRWMHMQLVFLDVFFFSIKNRPIVVGAPMALIVFKTNFYTFFIGRNWMRNAKKFAFYANSFLFAFKSSRIGKGNEQNSEDIQMHSDFIGTFPSSFWHALVVHITFTRKYLFWKIKFVGNFLQILLCKF